MANWRVMVVSYGYADVEADTEEEALEECEKMRRGDFDWTEPDDAQVIEELDY